MATTQEQRREANREKARERIARASTDAEIKEHAIREIEGRDTIMYVNLNMFRDAAHSGR